MTPNRKKQIKKVALDCLIYTHATKLPLDVIAMVRCYKKCRLVPYSIHMKKYGLNYQQMVNFAESEDACAIYKCSKDRYLIFYNDIQPSIVNSNRYRWNIIHELGHILLNHHKLLGREHLYRNGFSKKEYTYLESEANQFAAYVLVPHAVLKKKGIDDKNALKDICQISKDAAKYRFEDYITWCTSNHSDDPYDIAIENLFHNFICEQICDMCGFKHHDLDFNFCPICGVDFIKRNTEGFNNMFYDDFEELNENGRLETCHTCENEDIDHGIYCPICGSPVENKCTGDKNGGKSCGTIMHGNFRYCPKCGSKTTFLTGKLLTEWQIEYDLKQNALNEPITYDDDDVPF